MKSKPFALAEPASFRGAGNEKPLLLDGPKKQESRPPRRRWLWLLVIGILLTLVAVRFAVPTIPEVRVATATDNELRGSFTAEAYVRGKEYVLSPSLQGRVSSIYVKEGDQVEGGQLLLVLDTGEATAVLEQSLSEEQVARAMLRSSESQLDSLKMDAAARRSSAKSELKRAKAQLDLLLEGARSEEIEQAGHHVDSLRANAENAAKAYVRAKNLYEQGAIARANVDAAEATHRATQAELQRAQAALSQLLAGPRPEEVRTARAAVEIAEAGVAAANALVASVNAARESVNAARARLSAAQSAVRRARSTIDKIEIRAPDEGVVSKVSVEEGMQAIPGVTAIVLSSRRDFRIEAEVSSEDAAKVVVGMPVKVTSPAYPGQTFAAKLATLSPVGELKPDAAIRTRIVRARIQLNDNWDLLKPGMEVDVEGDSVLRRTLLVPSDALLLDGNQSSVWIVSGEATVQRRVVKTGLSNASQIEIIDGLVSGDRIVIDGKEDLTEGQRVKVHR